MTPTLGGAAAGAASRRAALSGMRCQELYRVQDLNPVYQNPDRRGRAELRSATRDDQDGERLLYTQMFTCVSES